MVAGTEDWLGVFLWVGRACGDWSVPAFRIESCCFANSDQLPNDHDGNPGECEAHDDDDGDTINNSAALAIADVKETHADRYEVTTLGHFRS